MEKHEDKNEETIKGTMEEEKKSSDTKEEAKYSPDVQRRIEELTESFTQAGEGLSLIDRNAIVEIRAFPAPPKDVGNTISLVAVLLGHKDLSWPAIKKNVLANTSAFLEQLKHFDAWNVKNSTARRARKIALELNTSAEMMRKKSVPAGQLYAWTEAVLDIAGFSPQKVMEAEKGTHEEEVEKREFV